MNWTPSARGPRTLISRDQVVMSDSEWRGSAGHGVFATERMIIGPMVTNPGTPDWSVIASMFATLND
jgi:hypothetical protein